MKRVLISVIVIWFLAGFAVTLLKSDPVGKVYIIGMTVLVLLLLSYGLRHSIKKDMARNARR